MTVAYRAKKGRAHFPDPHLDAPEHDGQQGVWGWSIQSLCGREVHRAKPTDWTDNLCLMCAQKAGEK